MKDAIIKDLELQWKDHFHMRDQSWKTVTYTAVFFVGILGLEIKGSENFVMYFAYCLLILVSTVGGLIVSHHRLRQKQKFEFIKKYEQELGLYDLKKDIILSTDYESGAIGRIFTAVYLEVIQYSFSVIGIVLIFARAI